MFKDEWKRKGQDDLIIIRMMVARMVQGWQLTEESTTREGQTLKDDGYLPRMADDKECRKGIPRTRLDMLKD
ncbi:hypothetical protein DB48_05445 [Shewanella sp. cp20]|nr:hypothetical protein DB48_05445 [Shewanella sp. cp20]